MDQLREHQSYIQLRDYYSSQVYFDDLDLSIKLTFNRSTCGVLSERCRLYDLLDEHFQMGVELLEVATKMIKERSNSFFIFYLSLGDGGR